MPLVFITGASSGLGQALAERYARAGWQIALVARRADTMQQWVHSFGIEERAGVYPADVSQPAQVIAAAEQCLARQGVPEVVIACAGISEGMDTAIRADLAVLRDTLAVNTLGMAATFHPFIQPMTDAGRGTLVGIASVAAIRGLPGHGAYCASKAGVIAYCESLRGELHGRGLAVVTLLPGFIDTPMTRGNRYRMPFLMSASNFADRAFLAIAAHRTTAVIPWQMGWAARLLRLMPDSFYDRIMRGRGRKKRRGEQ
jgi:short-subunit dehydrogenase